MFYNQIYYVVCEIVLWKSHSAITEFNVTICNNVTTHNIPKLQHKILINTIKTFLYQILLCFS